MLKMLRLLKILILIQILQWRVAGWHDLTNVDYHCWPLSASAANPVPYSSCPGVNIRWIEPPPSEIRAQVSFNTTYELTLGAQFFPWAVSQNIFNEAGGGTGISNATEAEYWCKNTICPIAKDATQVNCCIHHVNVHACPLSQTSTIQNGLCGPWIPAHGSIFTHSTVHVGPVMQGNWTSHVEGLYQDGEVSMIAHFKLAKMHIAVEKTLKVLPRTVCGDGVCESLDSETCDTCPADCGSCPLKAWQIALIVMAAMLAVGVPISACGYIRYQKRKLFWDESWILPYEELKQDAAMRGTMASMGSIRSLNISASNGGESYAGVGVRNQMFAVTATYDGLLVVVRSISKTHFTLTKKIREEVKTIRELEHPNLCRFIGGCVQLPNICIISEYCPKGSLNDVLLNDEVNLNWSFRFSFATDIARGLGYLHQHKVIHGRVRSNNCVVDDRWTVKMTDYGLEIFREADMDEDQQAEFDLRERKLRVYKGPEFWGMAEYNPTFQGDVYAYGIILNEIATRNDPYGDQDPHSLPEKWRPPIATLLDEKEQENSCPCPGEYILETRCRHIATLFDKQQRIFYMLFPIPHTTAFVEPVVEHWLERKIAQTAISLIEKCCLEWPPDRPTFEMIKRTLQKINPTKLSAVDLMMNMMQNYSRNLEVLVAERTQDLMSEKQKTDRLLYNMLPKVVADNLRIGKPVNAENYESCTIYFSDIVSFTTLSSNCMPMDVVALLNKLYTTFDDIIDKYDVYKVETIGDAYMVVSGVPKVICHHAKEVADMALDIVQACREFVIPHRPEDPLQIRVGLHSGSVCAGVVGQKMPRYCLFGDTVNTASRMESNSEPYRIHISDSTHVKLMQSGGHICKLRGVIPIKGKGDMKTWWIIGRTEEGSETSSDVIVDESFALKDKSQQYDIIPNGHGNGNIAPYQKLNNNHEKEFSETNIFSARNGMTGVD